MTSQFFVGAYTSESGGEAEGIGRLGPDPLDRESGESGESGAPRAPEEPGALVSLGLAVRAGSPSFLAYGAATDIAPDVVYAVDEARGAVAAFAPDGAGTLRPLGSQPTSGTSPCHLSATPEWLYASNYGTGEIDVFPLGVAGAIGPRHHSVAPRGSRGLSSGPHPAQDGPHAHATLVHGRRILGADLGADTVGVHEWDDGRLERVCSIGFPAGTGPRDFAVHPDGRVFVLGELSGAVFELGGLDTARPGIVATGTAGGSTGDHAAGLVIGNDGRHLYAGLRGSNRIAVIDATDLRPVASVDCGGDWPRHLVIDGGTLLVACERSGTIAILPIDTRTGIPRFRESVRVPTPTYLLASRA